LAEGAEDRVIALDLIRGVAVLGILVINISGFAGPTGASLDPHILGMGGFADEVVFAGGLILFEGKMRALFTMLFGASMVLFIERAEAAGRDGDVLQLRRLGWLALFGLLHYFLLWWGDILFTFAVGGILALFMRELPRRILVMAALVIFAGWHLGGLEASAPQVASEERVRLGAGTPAEVNAEIRFINQIAANARREMAEYKLGFADQVAIKIEERPFWQIEMTWPNLGETLPLMMIGMALYRGGFFTGGWSLARLRTMALVGTAGGLTLTVPIVLWLWTRGFPPQATTAALLYALAVPHLLMAAGYAALLVMAVPRLARTAIGRRLIAAGRMAFTNYIATTILMTAIFYGWGLGLIGTIDRVQELGFVLLAWALMLGFSAPWLAHFRQGPLEWLWRSLTERQFLSIRR